MIDINIDKLNQTINEYGNLLATLKKQDAYTLTTNVNVISLDKNDDGTIVRIVFQIQDDNHEYNKLIFSILPDSDEQSMISNDGELYFNIELESQKMENEGIVSKNITQIEPWLSQLGSDVYLNMIYKGIEGQTYSEILKTKDLISEAMEKLSASFNLLDTVVTGSYIPTEQQEIDFTGSDQEPLVEELEDSHCHNCGSCSCH
jgi:hypothetical protein